jgi:hypothetical protein
VADGLERLFVEAEKGAEIQASLPLAPQEKLIRIAQQWTASPHARLGPRRYASSRRRCGATSPADGPFAPVHARVPNELLGLGRARTGARAAHFARFRLRMDLSLRRYKTGEVW